MKKLFVSMMCLMMFLTGCADESAVVPEEMALPVLQEAVSTPTAGDAAIAKSEAAEAPAEKQEAAEQKPAVLVSGNVTVQSEKAVVESTVKTENTAPVASAAAPAKTEIATAVTSAKTDIPSAVVSAKTDPQVPVEIETPATPEPTAQTADLNAAMTAANAYAADEYGVSIDTDLGFVNSEYRFPAYMALTAPQSDVEAKAKDMVDYTFQQLMALSHKTVEDVRTAGFSGNVYAYVDGESIAIYFFYEG